MIRLKVNEILEEQDHSRYWLCNQLGMTYANLKRLADNETHAIRFDTLEKLCMTLKCTPSELIEIIPNDGEEF